MNFSGILIGVLTFFLIGLFHPIVIYAEYYFGSRCWPVFLLVGILCMILSVRMQEILWSVSLGVLGVSCFWSIKELKEQEKRVAKGWFPKRKVDKHYRRKRGDEKMAVWRLQVNTGGANVADCLQNHVAALWAGKVLAYLMGNYDDSKATYEKLFDWTDEHKFKTGKYSHKEAVIDELATASPSEYLTKISIQVF